MCDYIEPVGGLKEDTHLVLKKNGKLTWSFWREKKNTALEYEVFYLLSFHLGPDWRLGAVYYHEKENFIPKDVEFESFSYFFAYPSTGDIVIHKEGVQRIEDFRIQKTKKKGYTILTSYAVEYSEDAVFNPNQDAYKLLVRIIDYLQSNFMLVKYYRDIPIQMQSYFNDKTDYFEHIKNVYNTIPNVFPIHRICSEKGLSVAMEYWPIVIYNHTPAYPRTVSKEVCSTTVSELMKAKMFPLKETYMRFRSDILSLQKSSKAVFVDAEYVLPIEMARSFLPKTFSTSDILEIVNLYLPEVQSYEESVL